MRSGNRLYGYVKRIHKEGTIATLHLKEQHAALATTSCTQDDLAGSNRTCPFDLFTDQGFECLNGEQHAD
ncbi:MAG: hypothetical protein FRX49_08759 [Trebouxia sp. A1-2]|nr:MAG: hypothetical protein FRX49_08759 [Trebouxia sp. A1-2]